MRVPNEIIIAVLVVGCIILNVHTLFRLIDEAWREGKVHPVKGVQIAVTIFVIGLLGLTLV